MSIRFRCPKCNSVIKVSDRHSGEKGKCSTCRARIMVPTLEQVAKFNALTAAKGTDPNSADAPLLVASERESSRNPEKSGANPTVMAVPVNEATQQELRPVVAEEAFEEVADVDAAEPVEVAEAVDIPDEFVEEEELAPVPAPSISMREGNDILSAVGIPTDLVHIHDGEEDHAPPLIKKSVGLEGVEELVDMTAMVDIVFFLLIFFMMTTMQNVNASIDTPTPDPDKVASGKAASSSVESDTDAVVIRIEADNSLKFDGEPIFGEKELRSKLGIAFPGGGNGKKLTVLGHGDAFHGTVVMVLDAAHDTQIADIKLAVQDEEQ